MNVFSLSHKANSVHLGAEKRQGSQKEGPHTMWFARLFAIGILISSLNLATGADLKVAPGIVRFADDSFRLKLKEMQPNPVTELKLVLEKARLVPLSLKGGEPGKLQGFEFHYIEKKSFFEAVGLKVRDIIVQLGDVQLDSMVAAIMAVQQLRGAKKLDFHFKRAGKLKKLHFLIED